MGLINLQTDLKSLKYGLDRPNLGSSNEPFITKEIPDEVPIGYPDILLRKGALIRGVEDVERIGKFFTTPRGIISIANQNSLAAQNPKIPGDPRNIYFPTSTLAQLPVNAVGGHLNYLGLDPTSNRNRYIDVYSKNYSSAETNKLTLLQQLKIGDAYTINNPLPTTPLFDPTTSFLNNADIGGLSEALGVLGEDIVGGNLIQDFTSGILNLAGADTLGIAQLDNNLLLNYRGGPGAELGILGRTKIKRTSFTIGSKGFVAPVPTDANVKDIKNYQVGRSRSLEYGKGNNQINLNNLLGVSKEEYLESVLNIEIPNRTFNSVSPENLQKFLPDSSGQNQGVLFGPLDKNTTLTLDPGKALLVAQNQGYNQRSFSILNTGSYGISANGGEPYLSQVLGSKIKNRPSSNQDLNELTSSPVFGRIDDNNTLTLDRNKAKLDELIHPVKNQKPLDFSYLSDGASLQYWVASNSINSASVPDNTGPGLDPSKLNQSTLNEFIGYDWSFSGTKRRTLDKTYGPTDDNSTLSTNPIDIALNPTPSTGRAPKYKNKFKRFKFANPETGQVNGFSGFNTNKGRFYDFNLKLINAENPSTPKNIYFQSIIDSFSESHQAQYDKYNYVGRGYAFHKYTGLERNIQLGLTLVANNKDNLETIYRNLHSIQQYLAPNYSEKGYLRGNFFKLTIGNYYVDLPGIITSFQWEPVMKAGTAPDEQVFKVVTINSLEFIPIADNNNNIIDINSNFINYAANLPEPSTT
jgi:hypothetical protein